MTFSFCNRTRKSVDQPKVAVTLRATGGVSRLSNSVILSKAGSSCPSRRTSNYSCLLLVALVLLSIQSAAAQTQPSGPVHFPSDYTTSAPATTPASTTSPAVPTASTASTANTAEDIRDIRGPISIPYQYLWAAYLVTSLAVAGLLYALWRWFHGRVKIKAKLPYEIALDRLEAARALMTETQVREYAFAVSEVIRSYIEQRFGEKAARRTTEEFLSDLLRQTGTPLAAHRNLLEDFLNHCDLPKFARWQLSVNEMELMHESARTFILETRPQSEPAKPVKAPAQSELAQVK